MKAPLADGGPSEEVQDVRRQDREASAFVPPHTPQPDTSDVEMLRMGSSNVRPFLDGGEGNDDGTQVRFVLKWVRIAVVVPFTAI